MKTMWMVWVLAAAPAWAQDVQKEAQAENLRRVAAAEEINRLVTVKYVEPLAAQRLLGNFGVQTRADSQLKVIAISGRRAAVETAEAAIRQLDVPGAAQKDIDLTVFFIVGRDEAGTGSAIPADLQSTVAALKQTFPYKTYELLDALALRSRAGSGAGTTGQIGTSRLTTFNVRSVNVEEGSMIRIEQLHAGVRMLQNLGGKSEYVDVSGVHTDIVDVKEGQKLVVGRSSLEGGGKALFLVLIAKLAQ